MKNIKDYDLEDLKKELVEIGEKPFRAEQIFKWLYQENVKEFDERKLSYISSNETNYLAFDLPSDEYHNELYESLMEKYSTSNGIKRFDNEFFIQQKKEDKIYPWEKQPNQVSIHTFIRNQIHHRKDNRGC